MAPVPALHEPPLASQASTLSGGRRYGPARGLQLVLTCCVPMVGGVPSGPIRRRCETRVHRRNWTTNPPIGPSPHAIRCDDYAEAGPRASISQHQEGFNVPNLALMHLWQPQRPTWAHPAGTLTLPYLWDASMVTASELTQVGFKTGGIAPTSSPSKPSA